MKQPPVAAGDKIRLINMPNDPNPVPSGTTGTVQRCVRVNLPGWEWQIWVHWDNGSKLSLTLPPDTFEKVQE